MIDIERAERFSPFRVWARGGQAPLRAQAVFLHLSSAVSRSPRAARRAAWLHAATADDYITAAAAVGIDS
jgi:hypothetical protein